MPEDDIDEVLRLATKLQEAERRSSPVSAQRFSNTIFMRGAP